MPRRLHLLSLFLAAITLLFLLAVWLGAEPVGEVIGREDQFIEYMTALLFLLGSIVSGYAFLKGQYRAWAAFWCIACFVFMGEEISWFQRILGFSVPTVEAVNAQGEFNLHNMQIFGSGRLIGAEGYNLSIGALMNSQNLFRLGFFTWFLVLPLLTLLPSLRRLAERLDYVRPRLALLAPLWVVLVFAAVLTLSTASPIKDYIAEATEFGYSAMVFLYTLLLAQAGATARSAAPLPYHTGANPHHMRRA